MLLLDVEICFLSSQILATCRQVDTGTKLNTSGLVQTVRHNLRLYKRILNLCLNHLMIIFEKLFLGIEAACKDILIVLYGVEQMLDVSLGGLIKLVKGSKLVF